MSKEDWKDKFKQDWLICLKKFNKQKPWKRWLMISVFCILLLILTLDLCYFINRQIQAAQNTNKETIEHTVNENVNTKKTADKAAPISLISKRRIDGMPVATADANKWPIAVMIENAAFDGVRPQAGLSRALLVYEIIVEGGITRFMAVFGGEDASLIGPVRSARDTYLEFASELHAVYTHAGGSYTALQSLRNFPEVTNLDALSADGKYFWRDNSRYSPHNLFTSTEKLTLMLRDKGLLDKTADYTSWKFADNADLPNNASVVNDIQLDFSTPSYSVEWKYNSDAKYYERYNGGELQHDRMNNEVLSAKNVIVQIVPPGWYIEGKGRINFSVTGEGKAYLFNQGFLTEATWKKADRISRTLFYDNTGKEITFNSGNIWIEILPSDRTLTYQ